MTQDEQREDLVKEVENKILNQLRHVAKTGEDWPEGGERWTKTASRAILSLFAERLADVTPEMVEARAFAGAGAKETWRAMLSASVLGKGGKEK